MQVKLAISHIDFSKMFTRVLRLGFEEIFCRQITFLEIEFEYFDSNINSR